MWEGLLWHALESIIYGICITLGEKIVEFIWRTKDGKVAEEQGGELREGDSE